MPAELHPQHVANVLAMDPSALMTYFLSTVTDRDLVYALSRDARWVTYRDEDRGRSVFPVWAHPTADSHRRDLERFLDAPDLPG